ncbi:MAG: electron transporter RnfD [Lachnospiraceae bacterium]|nr:electron transporter RnfD [Lachnospiraceae bacterium]
MTDFITFDSGKERLVDPAHDELLYCGRIDDTNPHEPVFVQPGSFVRIAFSGSSSLRAVVVNHRRWNDSRVGVLVDQEQRSIGIEKDDEPVTLLLAENLDKETEHIVTFFKRMDQCHEYRFLGFLLEDGAKVGRLRPLPGKKIEFYGDSVTAGEVSEAVSFCGMPDPPSSGEYNNSYFSYAWATARRLHAQAHIVAHGGIAMMDGLGYMQLSDGSTVGMESCYDKVYFYPEEGALPSGRMERWNFARFTPQVVVAAVGQNDAYPFDFMKEEEHGEQAIAWRAHYKAWIESLRRIYPDAWIVLMTTILEHHPSWDRSIGRVCAELNDPKIVHFLFEENGRGTPGHIRVPEAMNMALELGGFIESLSDRLWS